MRSVVGMILVLVMLVASGGAQAPVAVETLGPQPGAAVPVFSLPDQDGRPHALTSLLGPKGAMLVFSRSADW